MIRTSRPLSLLLVLALCFSSVGCCCHRGKTRRAELRQAKLQSLRLYRENQNLCTQVQMIGPLSQENSQLQQSLAAAQHGLEVASQRLANLNDERSKLHEKYTGLLSNKNPLGGGSNRRFEELAKKYPEFEFDPVTGVSRFNGDLLFASGSDAVRPQASGLLQEFTAIMNDSDARQFDILVVGHTDDQEVVKASTRAEHETNWELSAHRATAVVRQLGKIGLAETRMGVAGYSKFQPVAANTDDSARQQNRRVEIYILAPDAQVAGWDGPSMVR